MPSHNRLRPRFHQALLVAVAVSSTSACVRSYRPPSENEPHAVVKFRRSYEEVLGAQLRESVDIDAHRAFESTTPAGALAAARTDVVLVHPMPANASVNALFYHTEMRMVQEEYTVQEPYSEYESYDCSTGFGTDRQYKQCSRMVTKYRDVKKHRMVTKAVEVSDGQCQAHVRFAPRDGAVYLLQYSYGGNGVCSLSCFEQVFVDERAGTFDNRPCPAAPPPG